MCAGVFCGQPPAGVSNLPGVLEDGGQSIGGVDGRQAREAPPFCLCSLPLLHPPPSLISPPPHRLVFIPPVINPISTRALRASYVSLKGNSRFKSRYVKKLRVKELCVRRGKGWHLEASKGGLNLGGSFFRRLRRSLSRI